MEAHPLILVIDDEAHIADVVVYMLEEHGFRTVVAHDGDAGLARFHATPPDLVILDLNLPGISGLDLFQIMRREQFRLPIIMLTSRSEEVDRILGLELGADDYVTKPFSPRELAARVKAVLRRTREEDSPGLLRQGRFALDEEACRLTYHNTPLTLTRAELLLMAALLRHPARVFSRDDLIRHMYQEDHPVTDRSVDACVKRLRRKFQEVRPEADPIETIYGLGYKLRHEPEGNN